MSSRSVWPTWWADGSSCNSPATSRPSIAVLPFPDMSAEKAGALGLGALFAFLPGAFNVVLLAGALYIVWVGISVLRSTSRC